MLVGQGVGGGTTGFLVTLTGFLVVANMIGFDVGTTVLLNDVGAKGRRVELRFKSVKPHSVANKGKRLHSLRVTDPVAAKRSI
jgi:hypothetical protein